MGTKSMMRTLTQRRQIEEIRDRQEYLKGWGQKNDSQIMCLRKDLAEAVLRLQHAEERIENLQQRSRRAWWRLWGR